LDAFLLRDDLPQKGKAETQNDASSKPSEKESDRTLHCAVCRLLITAERSAISRDGKHKHAFFNPSGRLFEIACFSEAPGCLQTGAPSFEFSWFSGFYWRVCLCRSCGVHIGWQFQASGDRFYGLILDMLVPMDPSE
jgi:hypothetical protein